MTGVPGLLGALGLVGVVFALLHFFLGIFGTGLDLFWVNLNLIGGALLLVIAAVLNFDALRERMRSGEARRAGRYGTSAILSSAFTIAILAMLAFLASRYHTRFDWTEQNVHSLSDQSLKVLDALDRDVEVLALYSPLDATPVRELLDRYDYASERFHVEFADPNERPELLGRYGITPEDLGRGLMRIALGDESVEIQEVGEESVTNAMVKLSRTGEKKVYFLEGHNERPIASEAAGDGQSYARAAEALRNENYQVEALLLAAQGEVPDDADVVIVAGATRPLLRAEREALERYLERGGALLVLIDPRAKTDLVEDVRRWGVDLGDDVIVDRTLALFGRATSPFAGRYDPSHDITAEMREPTLFHVARSASPGENGAGFVEIVFTGDDSWAERDLERFYAEGAAEQDDDDLPGPVAIAVAGTPRVAREDQRDLNSGEGDEAEEDAAEALVREPRLVVFGDSDFASSELIEAYRNRDLFVNTVNWLMGDVEAISVRPNRSRASRFQLTQEQFGSIRSLSLFVLPQAIAVIGVIMWWARRRAPGR